MSDLEVDYTEEEGKLYYFKYKLAGSDDFIPVATTRPETILGDEAVCVHPEDERFKHLVGKQVEARQIKAAAPSRNPPGRRRATCTRGMRMLRGARSAACAPHGRSRCR